MVVVIAVFVADGQPHDEVDREQHGEDGRTAVSSRKKISGIADALHRFPPSVGGR